ncbi:hypothetical protein N0V95_002061 [Ascochyta clinopodiicola]|nr:hypothetical protein N0V95_002061 [Ascochyta clinopodiicola]
MMKKHRIGRIELPWTNLEPPIRHPDYYNNLGKGQLEKTETLRLTDNGESERKRSHDLGSVATTNDKGLTRKDTYICRTTSRQARDPEKLPSNVKSATPSINAAKEKKRHRVRFAIEQEEREVQEGIDENSSLDTETQNAILTDYRELHEQFKAEGLYQCNYTAYAWESLRYSLLFTVFAYLLYVKWYILSIQQQIMFTAHDAGHRAITGDFVYDTLIAAFIGDFCCGLSIGWWKSSHNIHHLVTNMPEHDPDIQNIPMFSTTPTYMKSINSSYYNYQFVWDAACDLLVPYQKWWYYPIMAFARFNLYVLGWLHLLSPRAAQLGAAWWTRHVEIVFMCCYWYLYGYLLVWLTVPTWPVRVGFILVSHMVTIILQVQITLSHWGMSTSDLGPTESFPSRQMRTTMDIDCPPWMDWFHGGLQFQTVHHLFPRVPRHNLRRGQELVRAFSEKSGVKYHCHGFVKGNKVVLSRLEQVSAMVKMMLDCQKYMVETRSSGLH